MLKHLIMLFRTFPVQLYATSLTYYTLLAIVPILAFWLWLLESLHIDALFHTVMHGFLDPMGDIGETVGSTLFDFVHNTHSGFLHHFTLLFFFLSIFILINKLDNALNAIWGLSSNLDKKYLRDWGLLAIFILLSSALFVLFKIIADHPSKLTQEIISYVFSFFVLTGLFKFIPRATVKTPAACYGALFCLIIWLPLSRLFQQLVLFNNTYIVVYHDFVGVIITLIWINMLWLLFLSGAIISRSVQETYY